MKEINRKQLGRLGLSMAINYFTIQGYTISIPMNDTQWYDMVIEKDGKFYTVQCKATATKDGIIDFRSTGGTNGAEYDNVLNHSELDYLFCVDANLNMWNIPMKDILNAGNRRSIQLRNESNKNNQGFQTFQYRVRFSDQA